MKRHELTTQQWDQIKDLLPAERGRQGRPAKDNRQMINAMLWVLTTGAPWRDLPEQYGPWESVYTRFSRWSKSGVLDRVLEHLAQDKHKRSPHYLIDATIVKAHQHSAGAKGGSTLRL